MVHAMAYEEYTNEDLLAEYKRCGDNKMKQELVLRYSYLVKAIAMQMRGIYINFAEIDDIINEGIIALMGAIEKFDISKNVKLETYASLRIKGTIVDLVRKQDWIPRSVRKKAKEIDKAAMDLYEKNGVMPEDSEVAEYMKMSLDKYYKTVGAMNLYNVISLDSIVTEFQDSFNVMPLSGQSDTEGSPIESLQKKELNKVLIEAINDLSDREKLIISLYYRKELSMKEISNILEVSEPRVSQLHSSAIRKLRIALQPYVN
ncbi:MAG: FliA/WhiG family RNA polymerase sigma factor [Firmicutes bacterium]|nr:FliA/WhiG family RNA polymerase sigma factor [Bacillota bacterium]